MTTLSIITPVSPNSIEYFDDAAASVQDLRSAATFPVEWILCVDGYSSQVFVGPDSIVYNPEPWGVAAARNVALSQASGDVILPLDADDLLIPSGVIEMMKELSSADHGWVAGNRRYIDGSRTPHWICDRQQWSPGHLAQHWMTPFVFHPNCIVVHRDLALGVGGWPALRTNEDLAFVFALARISSGCAIPDIMLGYRSWPGQMTRSPNYLLNKQNAFAYIETVENAWRRAKALPTIQSPEVKVHHL